MPLQNQQVIWCDNLGAAAMVTNSIFHARTNHVKIDLDFVMDMVMQKKLEIWYVPTMEQTAYTC